jgi:hypothetical protein
MEAHVRLLRTLLPSLKDLGIDEWNLDFATAVKEIGAPCLELFILRDDLPPLIEALGTMNGLKFLRLEGESLLNSLDHLISLLECHNRDLLPSLKHLMLLSPFHQPADAKRFLESVGMYEAFGSVQELDIEAEGNNVRFDFLAAAFSGGAFAHLEKLKCERIGGWENDFAAFCDALAGHRCAGILKSLSFCECKINDVRMTRLGDLVVSGAFPHLEALELTGNYNSALVSSLETLKAASCPLPWTSLVLSHASMEDEELLVLLSVIVFGLLPRLERLRLTENDISNKGLLYISKTIKNGSLSNLTEISVSTCRAKMMYQEGATDLARAVVSHCPKLKYFSLSGKIPSHNKAAVKEILGERKGVHVYLS